MKEQLLVDNKLISFLASFVSLAGVVGLAAGFYNFFSRKKSLRVWLLFALVVVIPFVEIFKLTTQFPFVFLVIILALPYLAWSMWGYGVLLNDKKVNTKVIDGVILVSLWYQLGLLSL